jgi:hypothetical protein
MSLTSLLKFNRWNSRCWTLCKICVWLQMYFATTDTGFVMCITKVVSYNIVNGNSKISVLTLYITNAIRM